jgi:hypothetical protein
MRRGREDGKCLDSVLDPGCSSRIRISFHPGSEKMEAKLKKERTSIAKVQELFLTFATFQTCLLSHWPIPLSVAIWQCTQLINFTVKFERNMGGGGVRILKSSSIWLHQNVPYILISITASYGNIIHNSQLQRWAVCKQVTQI